MNSFHKSKKHIALFVLIMFLCTLMPFSAFAEEPVAEPTAALADVPLTDGFKYMKINSARAYYNASTCMMKDMLNWYYAPINLEDMGILSFAIQITQPVDLKVYKANDDYCAEYDEKETGMILKQNVQLGGNYESQFCGEFLGYVQGYELVGPNIPPEEVENMTEDEFQKLIADVAAGLYEDRKDYYKDKRVMGYTGQEFEGGRSLFSLFGEDSTSTESSLSVTSSSLNLSSPQI